MGFRFHVCAQLRLARELVRDDAADAVLARAAKDDEDVWW